MSDLAGRWHFNRRDFLTLSIVLLLAAVASGDTDSSLHRRFQSRQIALVLFTDSAFWQFSSIYKEAAQDRLDALVSGLSVYSEHPDGAIYFYSR